MPMWRFKGSPRQDADETTSPRPLDFHSRALEHVLEGRGEERWQVLDLGHADNTNLHFFVRRGAGYVVEDLWTTLAPCRSVGRIGSDCVARLDDLIDYPQRTRFDLVLAWDLLNYFDEETIRIIAARLARCCGPGSQLHALISREAELPVNPLHYVVAGPDTIRQPPPAGPRVIPCPRYTDPVLGRVLAPFAVEKTFLLKHHMQEFVMEVPRLPAASEGPESVNGGAPR